MAKAVKSAVKVFVVTFTIGLALTILPFLSLTPLAIAEFAALSAIGTLVGGLLSKGIDATSENFGTKVATKTATAPRQIIYGKARVGGTITHIETSGTDSHKLSMIVTLAGHELESLDEVLINDISVTSTSVDLFQYATNTKFKNTDNDNKFDSNGTLLRYKFIDGSQTAADSSVIANTSLTSSDKFIDVAYVFIEMVFDSEAFGGGIPPMSFVVKGKKVFDPRDSNQTFGTESTYTWSDNPALCVLDYITNTTYGLKATADEINTSTALGSFKVAANTCEFDGNTITTATVNGAVSGTQVTLDFSNSLTLIDVGQLVTGTGIVGTVKVASRYGNVIKLSSAQTIADGTTLTIKEKSYTANGITNMSADGGGVIEGLLSSCAGKLSYIDGKFVMFAGATVTPDMTITDDNLLAPITVQTRQTSGETFNQVKSVYIDANNNYVATDSPLETTINPATSNTFLSEDTPTGEAQTNYKKSLEIQLPFTDTTTMAQRLQRTALLHTRQKTALSVVCNIAYMQLQPFDWVYLTNERLGYTNKVFEVLSTNLEILDKDGVQVLATRLDLKEINNSVYTFASSSYTNPLDEGSSVSTGSFSVSPPTSLAVATTLEITGYDLNVSWTNNPDDLVQGTEVFYGTSSGTYTGSFIVGKGTAKESINGVKASTTYYIAVRHFSANNVFSALTSEVTVTTGTAPISYSTGGGNVGTSDTLNILGANLVLNDFNSTTGGDDSANYTFLNSGNGALGGVTSYQNSDTERIQFEFGEDPDGDWGKDFFTFDFDWGLAKGGADGNSMGVGKFHIKGRAADNGDGNSWLENTIATFEVKNADGNVTTPFVTLANTTITGSTTTPIIEVSQGSAPSTTTNRLYNVGGSLYWNGAVVDTGAGDITGVTINTSSGSLTGGASFSSGDATFTLDIGGTIRGSKSFEDDVVIEGNLDVQGTTTTIDTTNLDVKDKNITLNYGSGDTSANANGAGITIQDAVSATENATILWNTSADAFKFSHKIRLDDTIQAQFGNGADLQIYHDGTNSVLNNTTGNLQIYNNADDKDIQFIADDGSGGTAEYFRLDGGNGYLITSKHNQHLDNVKSMYGGSNDLQIYHDGSNSWIKDTGTGDLVVRSSTNIFLQDATGANNYAKFTTNAVELRHNNDVRFTTTSTGVDITGSITTDGMTSSQNITVNSASGSVDARLEFNNSVKNAWIGIPSWDNDSLRIYGTSPTTGNTNEPAAMYRDGAWSFWTDYSNTSGNGSTSTALFISTGGSLNVGRGDIQINGTTVIDSSRNLSNIASYNGYTPTKSSSSTNSVISLDSRNVNSSPSARNKGLYVDFKLQTTIGLTGSGSYAGVLTFRSYGSSTDLSGGYPIQIAYDQAGNLQTRYGSSSSAWGSWKAIHLAGNDLSAGNITVTGTVDGRDIATDGTKLDGIEAGATTDQTQAEINALGITAIGLSGTPDITVGTINSGAIDVTGTVTSDGLVLGDNDKAKFGDSNDLEIYHNGTHSYIADVGSGVLFIRGENNIVLESNSGSNYFEGTSGGASRIYYAGDQKLNTTSSGVNVTGTVVSDGLTVDGTAQINGTSAGQLTLDATGQYNQITFEQNSGNNSGGDIVYDHTNDQLWLRSLAVGSVHLKTGTTAGNTVDRLKVASNGDISFYEDTGTTAKLTWDASADSLNFVDNAKATFGASNDLEIYHDGSNSYIKDVGTGSLILEGTTSTQIKGSTFVILRSNAGENMLIANANGSVDSYYDGVKKLATTSTGIDVTGTALADKIQLGTETTSYVQNTVGQNTDIFRFQTKNGRIDIGSQNSSYAHFYTDRSIFYFSATLMAGNNIVTSYNGDLLLRRANNSNHQLTISTSALTSSLPLIVNGDTTLNPTSNFVTIKGGTNDNDYSGIIIQSNWANTSNGKNAGQIQFQADDDDITGSTHTTFATINAETTDWTGDSNIGGYITIQTSEANSLKDRLKVGNNGDISFYEDTGTTAKFFWDASAESLGLGTTSPSELLHIYNTGGSGNDANVLIEADGSGVNAKLTIDGHASGGQLDLTYRSNTQSKTVAMKCLNDGSFRIDTLGSEAMRIVGDNVGIGTDSPSQKLTVEGNIELGTGGYIYGDTTTPSLRLNNSAGSQLIYGTGILSVAPSFTYSGGGSERFRVTDTGLVGIGTNNPARNLVVNNSGTSTLQVTNDTSGLTTGNGFQINHFTSGSTRIWNYENGYMAFATNNSEVGRFDTSGNFLIGKTSAVYNTAGTQLAPDGQVFITGGNQYGLAVNRTTGDGDIVLFSKDGSTVGSIETATNTNTDISVGSDDIRLLFFTNGSAIIPRAANNGGADNTIDLGGGSNRFKDLYLSGAISSGAITSTGNATFNSNQFKIQNASPTLILKDTTDDDDHQILFRDSNDALLFAIQTQNADTADSLTFYSVADEIVHRIGSTNRFVVTGNGVSITGDATISGLLELSGGLSADQSGQTISGFSTIRVGDALIGQDVATLTTTATTQTNRILASATTYRTLKVIVQIKSSTNFHATEILLTHNGTTVYMTEYATIFSNTSLATFDADISGGNIRLLIDPNQSASTEFKFNVSGIEA